LNNLRSYLAGALPKTSWSVIEGGQPRELPAYIAEGHAAGLRAFVAANPDLGLIAREELEGFAGEYILTWAAQKLGVMGTAKNELDIRELPAAEREALVEQVLNEGLRWEEVSADFKAGYSLILEYALRGAGVVNLGITRTAASPYEVNDVLRTVAYSRLSNKLKEELTERAAEHNQALLTRPQLAYVERAMADLEAPPEPGPTIDGV